jgi:tartrate dehydratase beta subunit/fumarate hydratase class I family protein
VTFDVDKLPLIIVFDIHGKEVGRIVESAKRCSSLEEELSEIIKPE